MLTEEQIQRYNQDGFLVVKQFLSLEECQELKDTVRQLIDDWEPEKDYLWTLPSRASKDKSAIRSRLDSGDKVSFFVESKAVDPQTGALTGDKHHSVSSIGHALHTFVPSFQRLAFSDRIKNIARDLQFVEPALRQSLYIFKQAHIGEKVSSHRDSTYVFNEPFKVVGLWIALEDATIDNGCLWFIPGSHLEANPQRQIRNPNGQEFDDGKMLVFSGKEEQFDDQTFVPAQVKAGDLVLMDGNVVHKSEENTSAVSRQICAFHFFETHNSTYLKENWLQIDAPFPLLYDQ